MSEYTWLDLADSWSEANAIIDHDLRLWVKEQERITRAVLAIRGAPLVRVTDDKGRQIDAHLMASTKDCVQVGLLPIECPAWLTEEVEKSNHGEYWPYVVLMVRPSDVQYPPFAPVSE